MTVTNAHSSIVMPSKSLMDTYYTNEFTYNEYPHKSLWSDRFTEGDLQTAIRKLNQSVEDVSQMLFVNVPFCKRQCLFCICYTIITQDYARIQRYLEALLDEIRLFRDYCDSQGVNPDIREIHLGGGSPTLLTESDFTRLVQAMHSICEPSQLGDFALEVDPRGMNADRLRFYADQGVNRLSFGIQDFDPEVQKAIARVQPASLLQELLLPEVRERFNGVNFDILCGLPRQTEASFKQTIEATLTYAPDRIMLMFLNYCPSAKEHHRRIQASELPSVDQKWILYNNAVERLLGAGYVRIGFDHFAKPDDELAQAFRARTLHWNSLGYRAGRCVGMIGMGAGSLGRVTENVYYQNCYDIDEYRTRIAQGHWPVERGYRLTAEDKVRRQIVHSLRCHLALDYQPIEQAHGIVFKDAFAEEIQALQRCERDGLVINRDRSFEITEVGKVFTSYICGLFDAYIPKEKRFA